MHHVTLQFLCIAISNTYMHLENFPKFLGCKNVAAEKKAEIIMCEIKVLNFSNHNLDYKTLTN